MLLSKCAVCNSKTSKFVKEQKAKGLLRRLSVRTLLTQIPLLAPLLF